MYYIRKRTRGISVSSRLRFATFTSHFQNKNASTERRRWYYIIIMFCVVLYARGGCFHLKSVYCGLGGVYVTDLTRRTLWYLPIATYYKFIYYKISSCVCIPGRQRHKYAFMQCHHGIVCPSDPAPQDI